MATLEGLRGALIELDEPRTLELAEKLVAEGVTPMSILSSCQQALKVVGERYEREEYFISGLIMAGELFKEVIDIVRPTQEQIPKGISRGTILLGTVARDIHDIGKNMFATSLKGHDFEVVDLGVDVSPEKFIVETLRVKPGLVCLSGLILAAFESMKQTVSVIREQEAELGYRVPVIIGGAIIDGRVCEYCGADSWSTDALEGVRICEKFLSETKEWPAPKRFDG